MILAGAVGETDYTDDATESDTYEPLTTHPAR